LKLLRAFNGALAAPSANRSNHISPTTAEHVRRELGDAVDLILDGGPCAVGIESTVLDLSSSRPTMLRPGGISRAQIEAVIGPVDFVPSLSPGNLKNPSSSPGQQAVHYAPVAPAFRLGDPDAESFLKKLSEPLGRRRVLLIIPETKLAKCLREISDPGEIFEMPRTAEDYARQLYRALHDADDLRPDVIYVQEPPAGPEWDAVRDRIHRATRPIALELP
jgi:L-threonylcarbamoyladenylate synthase